MSATAVAIFLACFFLLLGIVLWRSGHKKTACFPLALAFGFTWLLGLVMGEGRPAFAYGKLGDGEIVKTLSSVELPQGSSTVNPDKGIGGWYSFVQKENGQIKAVVLPHQPPDRFFWKEGKTVATDSPVIRPEMVREILFWATEYSNQLIRFNRAADKVRALTDRESLRKNEVECIRLHAVHGEVASLFEGLSSVEKESLLSDPSLTFPPPWAVYPPCDGYSLIISPEDGMNIAHAYVDSLYAMYARRSTP